MSLLTKEEIMAKAEQMANLVSALEEVDFYKRAENQVDTNETIQQLIEKIKRQQKEAVNLQHYRKTEALKLVEESIVELQDELEGIPLVKEYKQTQLEVNKILQLATTSISKRIAEEISRCTGGSLFKS
ncbi:MAG: YlbF family regulator [Bacillaceae bacterium]|nr:YlbF family regulator [Bacillaceae bacterium]